MRSIRQRCLNLCLFQFGQPGALVRHRQLKHRRVLALFQKGQESDRPIRESQHVVVGGWHFFVDLTEDQVREARSGALRGQQRRGDGCPFRREIAGCRRAACLPIPIMGIVEIALKAVQVSVNPCAVRAFAVGDNQVRFIPIVFAYRPKRRQRRQKPVWGLTSRETMLEVRWCHDRLLDVQAAAIC